jgi:hypothetical protein
MPQLVERESVTFDYFTVIFEGDRRRSDNELDFQLGKRP